jgi:hypothetical protein
MLLRVTKGSAAISIFFLLIKAFNISKAEEKFHLIIKKLSCEDRKGIKRKYKKIAKSNLRAYNYFLILGIIMRLLLLYIV